jgi:hypothetical protein
MNINTWETDRFYSFLAAVMPLKVTVTETVLWSVSLPVYCIQHIQLLTVYSAWPGDPNATIQKRYCYIKHITPTHTCRVELFKCLPYIVMCRSLLMGFWVWDWIYWHLQVVTINNYNPTVNLHILWTTTEHAKSFQFAVSSLVILW